MRNSRREWWRLLVVLFAVMAIPTPAKAYYRHRYYRGGRGYNGMAAVQRASAAMNAADMRLYAAQMNLARQRRLARQQADKSPALASAKTARTQSEHDHQDARAAVVENLKKTNPEFNSLVQECQSLRQRVAAAAKSGNSSGNLRSLQAQLKSKTHRALALENEAIDADSAVKDARNRVASANAAETAARADAKNSVAQDPSVQAAQKQLVQANQQAMLAANRYGNASLSASSGSRYRRGYGHGRGYRSGVRHVSVSRGYRVQSPRFAQHRHR